MRLDVTALRLGLAVVNIAVLGLVAWVSYAFFLGERDELSLAIPNPAEYQVKERKRGAIETGDLRKVLGTIYRQKPVPRSVQKPTVTQDLPAAAGGPLAAEWKLISVYSARGQVMASIEKATQTVTTPSRTSRRRSTRPTRPTRTSGKGASKSMARRGPSLPTRHVVAGKEFKISGKAYECEKIEFEPKRLFYRDGGRLYTLEGTEPESRFSMGEQGLVLDGIPADEQDGVIAPDPSADDLKGSIEIPGKEPKKKAPVSRTPSKGDRKKPTRAEIEALTESAKKADTVDKEALRKALKDLDKKKQ